MERMEMMRGTMETLYLISGIIAVGLLIYLVIALMKPEIFS
jgi:K+-transporting ATPase KdpF subunit